MSDDAVTVMRFGLMRAELAKSEERATVAEQKLSAALAERDEANQTLAYRTALLQDAEEDRNKVCLSG